METIRLNQNTAVSRIAQGLWRLADWNMTASELVAFLEQNVELGVTTLDVAQVYAGGECERLLGEAFRLASGLRKKVQVVSKTGIFRAERGGKAATYYDTRYERILQSCKESLARLKCEYLDLYLIHREDPCIDHHEAARALSDLMAQGYVRAVGVSNFDPFKFDALQSASGGRLCTNQIEVNPMCYEHFSSGMLDVLTKERIHPMIWSPLCGGRIFTSEEEAFVRLRHVLEGIARRHDAAVDTIVYAWLLYHPVKAIPLSGSRSLARLKNAVAALDMRLEHDEWYEIYTASGLVKLR